MQTINKKYSNRSFCERKTNFILLCLTLFFYGSFFLIAYFAPLYFPGVFKHIFNDAYMDLKDLKTIPFMLHIQLFNFFAIFGQLVLSVFRTVNAKLSTIPNKEPWIRAGKNVSPQEQIENETLLILQVEEKLKQNGNKILVPKEIKEGEEKNTQKENENAAFIDENDKDDNSSTNSNTNSSLSVENGDFINIYQRDLKGGREELRFCNTCRKIKPDRCHHCKYCNECYLKLDHHCLWLDKCITIDNYKFFMLILFYAVNFISFFDYIFVRVAINIYKVSGWKSWEFIFLTGILINITLIGGFSLCLLTYHLALIAKNYTTFEYSKLMKENEKNENDYFDIDPYVDQKEKYYTAYSLFDVGILKNYAQVFGRNPFYWLVPVKNEEMTNEGLSFDINGKYADEVIASL